MNLPQRISVGFKFNALTNVAEFLIGDEILEVIGITFPKACEFQKFFDTIREQTEFNTSALIHMKVVQAIEPFQFAIRESRKDMSQKRRKIDISG